jgi:four helix bundle protein
MTFGRIMPGGLMGQSYRDLIAWQRAMAFVMEIYRTTASFPRDEVYGLAVQMRRAVVGISSNIAQGQGRFSPGEFHLCIGRARGAVAEVETQIMIAKNLGYLPGEQAEILLEQSAEIGKILSGLDRAIRPAA